MSYLCGDIPDKNEGPLNPKPKTTEKDGCPRSSFTVLRQLERILMSVVKAAINLLVRKYEESQLIFAI